MENPYSAFMEDETQGMFFQNALRMLASVDPAKIEHAIKMIDKETAIGPLMDPTAYMGDRFDNAKNYTKVFKLALPLVQKLQEIKGGS